MKKFIFIIVSILLFYSLPCYAQNDIGIGKSDVGSIVSLDLSYSFTSLNSHGWGIGVNYETSLKDKTPLSMLDYFALKGNFGHMTFSTEIENVYCTSVHLSLFINYYPLGNSLDKLYIGIGNGCDFMNYFGKGDLPDEKQDTLIHITPQIGWKFRVLPFIMIDVLLGYKIIINESRNHSGIRDYVNPGLRFGLNCLFLFNPLKNRSNSD